MEASGGSEYKIHCCLPIAHRGLFPNSLQIHQFHAFLYRTASAICIFFALTIRLVIPNSRNVFSVKVCLLIKQNSLIATEASVGSGVPEASCGRYCHPMLQVTILLLEG
jgi:hypothetical protein